MSDALVPDFIVGGAPRAGTSWLARALDAHPRIEMAKPWRPEPKVFLGPDASPAAHRERYRQWFGQEHESLVLGEKTTNYFESAEAPGRVAAALPDVRMIFLLREPVERAYSNWLWSRMNGLEDLPFAEAIELEGGREDPLPADQSHARPHDYLTRADYAGFARQWIDALGEESVGFFLYEDLFGPEGPATFGTIQRFAGVEPVASTMHDELVNEGRSTGEPLDDELRADLRERLRPLVEETAAITGIDVSRWGY